MENLLFPFVQATLEKEGVFEYIHAPGKGKSWVTAEDAAAIMIECLRVEAASKPEGLVLEVGGPEPVTPEKVAELLSQAMGRKVPYRQMNGLAFGEAIYKDQFKNPDGSRGETMKVPIAKIATAIEQEYKHWNDHPSEPMKIDMKPVLTLLPNVKLTRMEDWIKKQVWPQVRAPKL